MTSFFSDLKRRFQRPKASAFTWEGVYQSFADSPSHGDPFREEYAQESADMTRAAMQALAANPEAPLSPRDGGLLALIVAEVAMRKGRVRVLDFGGAAGIDYLFVRALTRRNPVDLEYRVVEHGRVCEISRAIHGSDSSIQFETEIDPAARPDIVHASGSICYIDDWRALTSRLIALNPVYFLLGNIFVGDFPTFATAQMNVPGAVIPYWFFSREDILRLFDTAGYRMVIEVPTGREYDQSNLPEGRRPSRARNLLFQRRA